VLACRTLEKRPIHTREYTVLNPVFSNLLQPPMPALT
jgi:hypothetical protein